MQVELEEMPDGSHRVRFDFVVEPTSNKITGRALFDDVEALKADICSAADGFDLNFPVPLCFERVHRFLPLHLLFSVIPLVFYSLAFGIVVGVIAATQKVRGSLGSGKNNKKEAATQPPTPQGKKKSRTKRKES